MRHSWLAQALVFAAVLCAGAQVKSQDQISSPTEEQDIRAVLARFYEGWNTHDSDKMVSAYAEDIDHINVFGEWKKGRATLRDEFYRTRVPQSLERNCIAMPTGYVQIPGGALKRLPAL